MQDLIVETKIIKSLDVAKHLQPLDPNDKTYDLVISKANVGLEDVKKLQTQLLKLIRKTVQNAAPLVSVLIKIENIKV